MKDEHIESIVSVHLDCFTFDSLWTHYGFSKSLLQAALQGGHKTLTYIYLLNPFWNWNWKKHLQPELNDFQINSASWVQLLAT